MQSSNLLPLYSETNCCPGKKSKDLGMGSSRKTDTFLPKYSIANARPKEEPKASPSADV